MTREFTHDPSPKHPGLTGAKLKTQYTVSTLAPGDLTGLLDNLTYLDRMLAGLVGQDKLPRPAVVVAYSTDLPTPDGFTDPENDSTGRSLLVAKFRAWEFGPLLVSIRVCRAYTDHKISDFGSFEDAKAFALAGPPLAV